MISTSLTETEWLDEADELDMKIGGLAPWFGAKRLPSLQRIILAELGKGSGLVEGCGGSGAITLAAEACRFMVYNDLYGPVVNVARVLASRRWPELHERLERTLSTSAMFIEARDIYRLPSPVAPSVAAVADEHLEAAYWFIVFHWQGRAGFGGTKFYNYHPARRYTFEGGGTARRFRSAVESLPAWAERFAQVEVRQEDAIELCAKTADVAGMRLYVDPPHIEKGAKYVHDFTPEQHAALAATLATKRKSRVVVSYYDHPIVRELYPASRWTWIECPTTKGLNNQGSRGPRSKPGKAPEVLIVNGPSYTQAGSLF